MALLWGNALGRRPHGLGASRPAHTGRGNAPNPTLPSRGAARRAQRQCSCWLLSPFSVALLQGRVGLGWVSSPPSLLTSPPSRHSPQQGDRRLLLTCWPTRLSPTRGHMAHSLRQAHPSGDARAFSLLTHQLSCMPRNPAAALPPKVVKKVILVLEFVEMSELRADVLPEDPTPSDAHSTSRRPSLRSRRGWSASPGWRQCWCPDSLRRDRSCGPTRPPS